MGPTIRGYGGSHQSARSQQESAFQRPLLIEDFNYRPQRGWAVIFRETAWGTAGGELSGRGSTGLLCAYGAQAGMCGRSALRATCAE